jgi:hypothetical protein
MGFVPYTTGMGQIGGYPGYPKSAIWRRVSRQNEEKQLYKYIYINKSPSAFAQSMVTLYVMHSYHIIIWKNTLLLFQRMESHGDVFVEATKLGAMDQTKYKIFRGL